MAPTQAVFYHLGEAIFSYMMRFRQAKVFPGLTMIAGLINAIASI